MRPDYRIARHRHFRRLSRSRLQLSAAVAVSFATLYALTAHRSPAYAQQVDATQTSATANDAQLRDMVRQSVLGFLKSRTSGIRYSAHDVVVESISTGTEGQVVARGMASYHYSTTKDVPLAGLLGEHARREGGLNDRAAAKATEQAELLKKDGYRLSVDRSTLQKDNSGTLRRAFVANVRMVPAPIVDRITLESSAEVDALKLEVRQKVVDATDAILSSLRDGDTSWATRVRCRLPVTTLPLDLRPRAWTIVAVSKCGYPVMGAIDVFVHVQRGDNVERAVLAVQFMESSAGPELTDEWWCSAVDVTFSSVNVAEAIAKERKRENESEWDRHEQSLAPVVASIRALSAAARDAGVDKPGLVELARNLDAAARGIYVAQGEAKMQQNVESVAVIRSRFDAAIQAWKAGPQKLRLSRVRANAPAASPTNELANAVDSADEFAAAFDALAKTEIGSGVRPSSTPVDDPSAWRDAEIALLLEQTRSDQAQEKAWARQRPAAGPGAKLALDGRIRTSAEGRKALAKRIADLRRLEGDDLRAERGRATEAARRIAAAQKRFSYFREMRPCTCVIIQLPHDGGGNHAESVIRFLGPLETPQPKCPHCGGTGFVPPEAK